MEGEDLREEAGIKYGGSNHFTRLSRAICFDNAIQVARIFQCSRQRFKTRQIFVTGMQHAGTAATALIAAIALIKDPAERISPLQHLRILAKALKDMACTYRPAERMLNVLEHVIRDFGWEIDNLTDPAPAGLTQRSLLTRDAIDNETQRMSSKFTSSPLDTEMGNPYALIPGLVHDSQQSESFVATDQYNDFDYTNMPFPAMTGANPMSWMKSMSTDNSMMLPGRTDSMGFVSHDDALMFSSRDSPMHYLEMARITSKDSSATREQGHIPINSLSAYGTPKRSQRATYMEGGSIHSPATHRESLSLESLTRPQVSWGEVLRQMGDSVE